MKELKALFSSISKPKNIPGHNADMLSLRKAAFNIQSKFGLLNAHRPLVLTVSEERQVYETLLKLILARVNAGTSFLRWAKKEENQDIKDAVCRLYDINLMLAQVQREYAELSNALSISLKEILQIEAGLDALRKQLKESSEKREKLQKAQADPIRKKLDTPVTDEEINKALDEEEALRSELEVNSIKAEIFKNTNLKRSLNIVCDANLMLAKKMELIYKTAKEIVNEIPEVPTHLKEKKVIKEKPVRDLLGDLAKELNMERTLSSIQTASTASVFHVDLPTPIVSPKPPKSPRFEVSPPLNADPKTPETSRKISVLQKMLGKVGLERPLPAPPKRKENPNWNTNVQELKNELDWGTELKDFVIVTNIPAPKVLPPAIPRHNIRRRSKSTAEKPRPRVYAKPFGNEKPTPMIRNSVLLNADFNDKHNDTDDDDDDYIEPNYSPTHNRLYRSSSDSHIASTTSSDQDYSEPWEHYMAWGLSEHVGRVRSQTDLTEAKQHYERPFAEKPLVDDDYDYSHVYEHKKPRAKKTGNELKDYLDDDLYTEYKRENASDNDDGLYCVPYDSNQPTPYTGLQKPAAETEYNDEIEYKELEKESDFYQNLEDARGKIKEANNANAVILSKPDNSNHHIVIEAMMPVPKPRHRGRTESETLDFRKKKEILHASFSTQVTKSDHKLVRKKLPPKPKPRPASTFYDKPAVPENKPVLAKNVAESSTNNKIHPASIVPSITQQRLKTSEYSQYKNDLEFP